MVTVDIQRAVTIQYLGQSYTKIIFIVYLKLKLNWIILWFYFKLLPSVSLGD